MDKPCSIAQSQIVHDSIHHNNSVNLQHELQNWGCLGWGIQSIKGEADQGWNFFLAIPILPPSDPYFFTKRLNFQCDSYSLFEHRTRFSKYYPRVLEVKKICVCLQRWISDAIKLLAFWCISYFTHNLQLVTAHESFHLVYMLSSSWRRLRI